MSNANALCLAETERLILDKNKRRYGATIKSQVTNEEEYFLGYSFFVNINNDNFSTCSIIHVKTTCIKIIQGQASILLHKPYILCLKI